MSLFVRVARSLWPGVLLVGLAGAPFPATAAVRLVVATEDAAGATADLYFLDLATGGTFEGNPRRSGARLRIRTLEQNVFQVIGRRLDQPAPVGHFLLAPIHGRNRRTAGLLLAETPTGYMALLKRLGRGGALGEIDTVSGRPGAPILAADGHFALLMRRGRTGATEAAYLYHPPSGGCLALEGLSVEGEPPAAADCSGLPQLAGEVSAAAIERPDGSTLAYLLVDGTSGAVWRATPSPRDPRQLTAAPTELDLAAVFPAAAGGEASRRFALAPLALGGTGATDAVLAADAPSGRLALLLGVADRPSPSASLLPGELYDAFLPGGRAGRVLLLLPRATAFGRTPDAWLFDSASNRILLLSDPGSAATFRIRAVEIVD